MSVNTTLSLSGPAKRPMCHFSAGRMTSGIVTVRFPAADLGEGHSGHTCALWSAPMVVRSSELIEFVPGGRRQKLADWLDKGLNCQAARLLRGPPQEVRPTNRGPPDGGMPS